MKRLSIVVAALFAAAAGGIAYAAIPTAGGTISGCYGKLTGIVRVIDAEEGASCLSRYENPISWSAQGPPGERGPQGERGPSDAYFRAGTATINALEFVEVVRVELPAGLYLVTVTGQVENAGPVGTTCELLGTTSADAGGFYGSSNGDLQTLALTGVATVTDPRAMRVRCVSNEGGVKAYVRLTAIQVGALR